VTRFESIPPGVRGYGSEPNAGEPHPAPPRPPEPYRDAGLSPPDHGRFDGGANASPPPAAPPRPAAPPHAAAFAAPAPPVAAPAGYQPQQAERYGAGAAAAPARTAGAVASPYALKRPIGRQIVLLILSLGLWGYYWFYDTRKKLNSELGKPDDAGVKTACLLIPIYNYILVYQLWEDLNRLRKGKFGLPDLNSLVLLLIAIFIPLLGPLYALPKVAIALNEYWDYRTQGQARDAPMTTIEQALAAVGLVLLVLVVIGIVLAAA
jgi:Zn-dependent protease